MWSKSSRGRNQLKATHMHIIISSTQNRTFDLFKLVENILLSDKKLKKKKDGKESFKKLWWQRKEKNLKIKKKIWFCASLSTKSEKVKKISGKWTQIVETKSPKEKKLTSENFVSRLTRKQHQKWFWQNFIHEKNENYSVNKQNRKPNQQKTFLSK